MNAPGESRLLNWVTSLEEGRGAFLLRGLLLVALALGLAGAYAHGQFSGLRDPEAMAQAQLARNLARGEGYRTQNISCADLWFADRMGRTVRPDAMPESRRAPGYAAALSVLFRLHGVGEEEVGAGLHPLETSVILPFGLLCVLLTAWWVYALGARLFHRRVGVLGMLLVLGTESLLRAGISGLPSAWLTLLAVTAWGGAAFAVRGANTGAGASWAGWVSLSALAAGVAALTRYGMLVVLPTIPLFLYLAMARRRVAGLALWLAVCALCVVPWLLQNQDRTGAPFGRAPHTVLEDSLLFPEASLERILDPALDSVLGVKAVERKAVARLQRLVSSETWEVFGGALLSLLLVSYLARFMRHDVDTMHTVFAAALLLALATAALLPGPPDILRALTPLAALFAAAFLFLLLDHFGLEDPLVRGLTVGGAILLQGAPLLLVLAAGRPVSPHPPYFPPLIREVGALSEPGELVCTDIPEGMAWYADRLALRLPLRMQTFYQIHDFVKPINVLYLTSVSRDRAFGRDLSDGREQDWLPLLQGQVPVDFHLVYGLRLSPSRPEHLVLSDRRRWREER